VVSELYKFLPHRKPPIYFVLVRIRHGFVFFFSVTTLICMLILYTNYSINSVAPNLCRGAPIENQLSNNSPLRVPAIVGLKILEVACGVYCLTMALCSFLIQDYKFV
jgi:hypothetical protein